MDFYKILSLLYSLDSKAQPITTTFYDSFSTNFKEFSRLYYEMDAERLLANYTYEEKLNLLVKFFQCPKEGSSVIYLVVLIQLSRLLTNGTEFKTIEENRIIDLCLNAIERVLSTEWVVGICFVFDNLKKMPSTVLLSKMVNQCKQIFSKKFYYITMVHIANGANEAAKEVIFGANAIFNCDCGMVFDKADLLFAHQKYNWCMKEALKYLRELKGDDIVLFGPIKLQWLKIHKGRKRVDVLLFGERHTNINDFPPKESIRFTNFLKYLIDSGYGLRLFGETSIKNTSAMKSLNCPIKDWTTENRRDFYTLNATLDTFRYFPTQANFSYTPIDFRQSFTGHELENTIDLTRKCPPTHVSPYKHEPPITKKQEVELGLNAGKLLADYYGHKTSKLAESLREIEINKGAYIKSHSALMDYPALAVIEEAIAADDKRPIVIYAGFAHTEIYSRVLMQRFRCEIINENELNIDNRDPRSLICTMPFPNALLEKIPKIPGPQLPEFNW